MIFDDRWVLMMIIIITMIMFDDDDFQWERMINHLFFLLNFSGKAIYPKKKEHKWDIVFWVY